MKKLILVLACLVPIITFAQNISEGEYFFDSDPGYGKGIAFTFTGDSAIEFTENISLAGVQPGFHIFYYRLKDDINGWGQTFHQPLYRYAKPKISELYYSFDDDQVETLVNINPDSLMIDRSLKLDISALDSGKHNVHFRVKNEVGMYSKTWTDSFSIHSSTAIQNVQDAEHFELYPNPVKDLLYINSSSVVEEIRAFDQNGKLVYKGNQTNKLDLSTWKSGLYLIHLKSGLGQEIHLIIKE